MLQPPAPHHEPDLPKLKGLAKSIRQDNQADWLEAILDKHAEYYIRQTMKFFQENGESPALSKNNPGDLAARAAITTKIAEERLDELKRISFTDLVTDETKDAFWPYVKSRYAELEAGLKD